ncbi:diguanylate cyclase domain-containing protein [Undibacterium sp. TJN25]|uniref:GGDEF domain-containing protein n=1 Tax=Undibacterium sp. TJN25 TaxID=3413056 RepID=UPI003BF32B00
MLAAPIPENEARRVRALHSLDILDTPSDERFDRLTRLVKRIFKVPIAVVSLVDADRQWFKSCIGLDATETSRDISFCGHAILGDDIFTIPDALSDERFHDNPLVANEPWIRFYAGCPLSVSDGSKIGTLCLIDMEPRELDTDQREILKDLARMAEQELAAVQLATMDALTSLPNRRGFESLAQHALHLCKRINRPASLLFFDLNGFKKINDTFGHAEGDRALATFADVLRTALRDSDVGGRLGGDEFVVLLVDAAGANAGGFVTRLQKMLDARNAQAQRGYDIRFSVGQIEYDLARHDSISTLLADADAAMYQNKLANKRL